MPYALPTYSGMQNRGSSGASHYRDFARSVYGGVARRGRDMGGRFLSRSRESLRGFVAPAHDEPSLGDVAASSVGVGVAAISMGALDSTTLGAKLKEMTGGLASPSTIAAAIGIGVRGLSLDRNFLGRGVTRANTALLRTMIPVWLYGAGGRIPGAYAARFGGGGGSVSLSGVETKEKPAQPTQPAPEPIPGEATVA